MCVSRQCIDSILFLHQDDYHVPLYDIEQDDTKPPLFRIPELKFGSGSSGSRTSKRNEKSILVTGGSGTLGLPLVKRLLHEGYDVTIWDTRRPTKADLAYLKKADHPGAQLAEYIPIYSDSATLGKLSVIPDDIRNQQAVTNVLHHKRAQYGGIIHLAGVARNGWCTEQQQACTELNVDATTHLYKEAMQSTRGKTAAPWFIYASSLDVYGYQGQLGQGTMNVLGKTKFAAETSLLHLHHKYLYSENVVPRTLVLRHATTFGSPTDFKDRLLPGVIGRAMMNMPLQIMDADERIPMMRIEDAVQAFLQGIKLLQQDDLGIGEYDPSYHYQGNQQDDEPFFGTRTETAQGYWNDFNIVSGFSLSPNELVNVVMAATSSSSPIQHFGMAREKVGPWRRVTPGIEMRVNDLLDFQAKVPFEIGLAAYIHERQMAFVDWAKSYLRNTCPGSRYSNSKTVHQADIRNLNMERLMGCTLNIGVNHKGWIHYLKCGERDGISCQADNIKKGSFNWNQTVFNVIAPDPSSISNVAQDLAGQYSQRSSIPFAKRGYHGKLNGRPTTYQFEEELTQKVLGYKRKKNRGPKSSKAIRLKLYDKQEAQQADIVTEFDVEASRPSFLVFRSQTF